MVGTSFKIQGGVLARPFIIGRIKEDKTPDPGEWTMPSSLLNSKVTLVQMEYYPNSNKE